MAKRIEDIDKNFVARKVGDRDLVFADVANPPFSITGLGWFDRARTYCRLPEERLAETNEGVRALAWHTAGAMVRFRSDTGALAIRYELRSGDDMPHMPRTGISGFDLYCGAGLHKRFVRTAVPGIGLMDIESLLICDGCRETREWTLNFPLYNGVKGVWIGVDPGSRVEPPTPFAVQKPIAFYGSSITQGGCASRPGNAYTHIVCRWLDAPLLNFGFSGSARAEAVMAELMMALDMSVFVYDYDHNAPSAEYLAGTHEPFFKLLRQAKPDLPIVMVGMPNFDPEDPDCRARQAIIRRTYENAVAAGDRRVYHINNELLFGAAERDACTVDGCHPNDLGFMRMARAVYPIIRQALAESR